MDQAVKEFNQILEVPSKILLELKQLQSIIFISFSTKIDGSQ
jgi:hypothetical protein